MPPFIYRGAFHNRINDKLAFVERIGVVIGRIHAVDFPLDDEDMGAKKADYICLERYGFTNTFAKFIHNAYTTLKLEKQFVVDAYDALPFGAEAGLVIPKFSHWVLTSPELATMIANAAHPKRVVAEFAQILEDSMMGRDIPQEKIVSFLDKRGNDHFSTMYDALRVAIFPLLDLDEDSDESTEHYINIFSALGGIFGENSEGFQKFSEMAQAKIIELIKAAPQAGPNA